MSQLELGTHSKPLTCGTLTYTKAALAMLFFWLLWGDFCYTLMESVTTPIMTLKFNTLEASNTEIGVIISTIPAIVYTIFNPIISFKSDRHRGPLGRRIPFILYSLPMLVLCLLGLAFADRIGFWMHDHLFPAAVSRNRAALWTMGAILIAFTFFNTFVTSVFWYLFNDVVPEHILGRFMSLFRMIGMLSATFYQFFIFRYSGSHSTAIFIGAALLYAVGFGLMCLNVKEGQYPPPEPYVGGRTGPMAAIETYAKECHSHSHYWYMWISTFIGSIGGGIGIFQLLFNTKTIGLTLEQIGYINGTSSLVISMLILGSGWLADRYHPIRVVFTGVILSTIIVAPANLIWLFWHPSPTALWTFPGGFQFQQVFVVAFLLNVALAGPIAALIGVWDPPLLMRVFPRSRYGQFCSTNAIWRSGGSILGGLVAGAFLDLTSTWVGKDQAFRYIPVWNLIFALPGLFLFYAIYQSWKRHGGDDAYLAPLIAASPAVIPVQTAEPALHTP